MENSPISFYDLAQQYRQLLTLCRQLEAKESFLRQRMVQLRGITDPQLRAVIPVLNRQLGQLKERMWQEDARMVAAARAVDNEIARLHDERLEQMLRCRYLELMTWEEISDIMGLGLRWLHRLHNRGIQSLGTADHRILSPGKIAIDSAAAI